MPVCLDGETQNPEKKSLHVLTIPIIDKDGIRYNIPALDKHWCSRSIFTNYMSLIETVGKPKHDAALEEWQHEAENFRNDMKFLLQCSHHEFWSYVIYQKMVWSSVVSFLHQATPFYINCYCSKLSKTVTQLYEDILNMVVRIVCRVLTPKESPYAWMKREYMHEILTTHNLISIPLLFDLLTAVGDLHSENIEILHKVFDIVMRMGDNYHDSLVKALKFFPMAFRSIHTQTENEGCEGAGGGLLEHVYETQFDDVVLYTMDCSYSLSVLLTVWPPTRNWCYEYGIAQSIAAFYDKTLPVLYRNIFESNEFAQSLTWLKQVRIQLLRSFRNIAYLWIEEALNNPLASLNPSEHFINLLSECVPYKVFLIDYQLRYPIEIDVILLKQCCSELDEMKINFLFEQYGSVMTNTIKSNALDTTKNANTVKIATDMNGLNNILDSNGNRKVRDVELEMTMVLDCLPDLGTGFVKKLLSRYRSSEEAIAAFLEENLPPDLAQADHFEMHALQNTYNDAKGKQYMKKKHHNIFDGDQYDIMLQDNPQCIIKKGKGFPNAMQLLNDKSDVDVIRHRYQEYTMISEDSDDNKEYNDEYDDSYDALLETEIRSVKNKTLSNNFDYNVNDDGSEKESDFETADEINSVSERNLLNFCDDPAELRARYEAQRILKWNSKIVHSSNKHQLYGDVVGGPKGKGQEKEVLNNRHKKEVNKSHRANHNRKARAAFKHSRGMIN